MHIPAMFTLLTRVWVDFQKQAAEEGRQGVCAHLCSVGWRNFHWIFAFKRDVEFLADADALALAIQCS